MPNTRRPRLALVQMSCNATAAENLQKALAKVAEAADAGANIVALPELFLGPYFCQRKDDTTAFGLAEPVPGPSCEPLAEIARRLGIVLVAGSLFEVTPEGLYYNTTPVFGPDGALIGTYRKSHIPEDVLYHEQHYFRPGDTGVRVFETPFGKIAPLICFDQWFPEAARLATLAGAEILIYPTAIGVIDEDVETNITGDWERMWRNAQLGHAATNNVYVAGLNRVGREGAITFWGGSFIADPSSAVLALGGADETILMADLDLDRVQSLQAAWRFLPNRRPDLYQRLSAPVVNA